MKVNNELFNQNLIKGQTLKDTGFAGDTQIKDLLDKFMVMDQLTLSDEGQGKVQLSGIEETKPVEEALDPLKDFKDMSFEDQLDYLMVDSVRAYEEALRTADSPGEVKKLTETYEHQKQAMIDEVSKNFDNFFDRGRSDMDLYSEEPVNDLFDQVVFSNHLSEMVTKVHDKLQGGQSLESIEADLSQMVGEDFEHMSIGDLYELYDFIDGANNFTSAYNDPLAGLADYDLTMNVRIDQLGLSEGSKDLLRQVVKRERDAGLMDMAYEEEKATYLEDKEGFKKMMGRILKQLLKINASLDAIKEDRGINHDDKVLNKYLARKAKLMDEFYDLKDKKFKHEQAFEDLSKNRHLIKDKESYKKLVDAYERIKGKQELSNKTKDK